MYSLYHITFHINRLMQLAMYRWFWPENGLVLNGSLFVFTPVLTRPCDIGCAMVGVSLITVHNPIDPPLEWRYASRDQLYVHISLLTFLL